MDKTRENLKSELRRFWLHCHQEMSGAERLDRLRKFASIVISKTKLRLREEVEIKCNKGIACFTCLGVAKVRHRIISLQNGGDNSSENLVSLCPDCASKVINTRL